MIRMSKIATKQTRAVSDIVDLMSSCIVTIITGLVVSPVISTDTPCGLSIFIASLNPATTSSSFTSSKMFNRTTVVV